VLATPAFSALPLPAVSSASLLSGERSRISSISLIAALPVLSFLPDLSACSNKESIFWWTHEDSSDAESTAELDKDSSREGPADRSGWSETYLNLIIVRLLI